MLSGIFQVLIVFVVVFGFSVAFKYFQQRQKEDLLVSQVPLYYQNDANNPGLRRVLGENDENNENKQEEHQGNLFAVRDITLGGETLMAMIEDDKGKEIKISHLQGKLYRSTEEDGMNYYASWQTNKPTLSTVKYKSDQEQNYKEIKEENYSYVHAITFPDVDFSSVYQYVISSRDRWGDEIDTGQFVFYTGSSDASFFELLEDSFRDIFGWMNR